MRKFLFRELSFFYGDEGGGLFVLGIRIFWVAKGGPSFFMQPKGDQKKLTVPPPGKNSLILAKFTHVKRP